MADEREVRPGWLPPQPPNAPPAPAPAPAPPVPARPAFVHAPPPAPPSPLAITAIVIGAVALLLLVMSLGVGYALCGPLSLLALALGVHARRRIRAGVPGREGQARAAIVLASIGLALALIAAIVWITLAANGYTGEDLQRWLEDQLRRQRRSS